MRFSTIAVALFAFVVPARALAQDEPPQTEPQAQIAEAKEAETAAKPPEVKTSGMRAGLDLSFGRSSGEAPDKVNDRSPSMIPLGAELSFRTSAKLLLGFHGHIGVASRDDCLGDSGCAARTYGLGAHIEGAFVSQGFFVPYLRYGIGWEMLHQKGMYNNANGYAYRHGLDILDIRFGGDFRLSENARLGPFVGMIAGLGLDETRSPSPDRDLESGHIWFTIGARGTLGL